MGTSINVGSTDRIVRLIFGILCIALPYFTTWTIWSSELVRWGIPVVGVVLVATALFRFCPLYKIFGLSSS